MAKNMMVKGVVGNCVQDKKKRKKKRKRKVSQVGNNQIMHKTILLP